MIRKLQKTDRDQLLKLFWEFHKYSKKDLVSKALQQFHEYKDIEKVYQRDVDFYIRKDEFEVFVAEADGLLVGYIAAKLINRPYRVLDKEAYIEDWFVVKEHQGKGLGEELFKTLTEELKRIGRTHIRLDTFTTNKKAQDIYHKYGFVDNTIEMYKKI